MTFRISYIVPEFSPIEFIPDRLVNHVVCKSAKYVFTTVHTSFYKRISFFIIPSCHGSVEIDFSIFANN